MAMASDRLGVVADIHGNLPALEAVAADLARLGVTEVVNLGDCVSGPLWPKETLDLLRSLDWPTVRGNHDRWVGASDRGGLGPSDAFAAAEVGAPGRAWLSALPQRLQPAAGVLAVHARPDDDNTYLLEDVVDGRLRVASPDDVARRLTGSTEALVLSAHSHLAAVVALGDGRSVLNPGSVGCPAYADSTPPSHVSESGSPLARYAIVTLGSGPGRPRIDFVALPYDHPGAARRASDLERPEWAYALTHGRMPR